MVRNLVKLVGNRHNGLKFNRYISGGTDKANLSSSVIDNTEELMF